MYAGLYAQYFEKNNEFSAEPRLGVNWQFAQQQSLNLGFGKHSVMLPRQTYYTQFRDTLANKYVYSNDYLGFIHSNHYVLGYNNLINKDFRFKAEVYCQQLSNIPVSETMPQFSLVNQGDFFSVNAPDSMVSQGTGTNYGMELTLEKFLAKGYYFLFTASLFDSKYSGFDGVKRNTAFNGNYVFNLLGGYEFKVGTNNRITLDMKTVWAGGKRYIPYSHDIYRLIEKGENIKPEEKLSLNEIDYDYANSYNQKYNDYIRFDLRIGFKMNKKRFNQEWGLDLQNLTGLFGYKSVFGEQYDPESNQIVKTYQQGFYPMMLWRIQF